MSRAKEARRIKLEGQEEGDPQHGRMGVYELEEGEEVNERGVWRATGTEHFLYYANNNEWFISTSREAMEVGKAAGVMSVASTALTPDKITETWQTVPGWKDAPKVSTRVYTAEEARQRAMAHAKEARRIKLEGLEEDDPMQILMNVYELEEEEEVNARGVWRVTVHTPSDEDLDVFMFYAGNNMWCLDGEEGVVCAAKNEEQGEPMMYVASSALTPDKITGTWQRLNDNENDYIDAPNVRARVYTGTCPQGHTLQQFQTQKSGYRCDLCGRGCFPGAVAGSTLHGCRTCDFDVCPGCL
jgi:hypothetical protein